MSLEGALSIESADDAVSFSLTVTNVGDAPAELRFRSGLSADVVVLEGDRTVWRWSDDRLFTQAMRTEVLAPGTSADFGATWDDPEPGSYEAVATLAAETVEVTARASFAV